jgi:prepilin-type processing-associated H-X9-DG protein
MALFDQFHVDEVAVWGVAPSWFTDPDVQKALGARPDVFRCPSDGELPPDAEYQHEVPANIAVAPANYALSMGTVGGPESSNPFKFENTGVFIYVKRFKIKHVTDGLSKTIFIGEAIGGHRAASSNIWSNGNRGNLLRTTANPLNTPIGVDQGGGTIGQFGSAERSNTSFASKHPGGANFGYGDGHIEFITDSINFSVYQWLSTRGGGETPYEGAPNAPPDDTPPPR